MDFVFEWILKPALGSVFTVGILAFIWSIWRPFFTGYTTEKGKNVATKEDIAEITQTVESVRTGFITSLELLKLELGKKALLHQLFAQKELEALARIWDVLFELQLATLELRPMMEETSAEESAEVRYTRKYKVWADAHNAFMNAIQKNQLFLDPELHRMLVDIKEASRKEASEFRAVVGMARANGHIDRIGGYDRAMENVGRMVEHINRALEMVRSKVDS